MCWKFCCQPLIPRFRKPYYKWQLIEADPDNKFVDVAIAANADFLVTNDRHFEVLKQLAFPRVPVIRLQEFLSSFR
jgi:predicted nucleic acid-binding protein